METQITLLPKTPGRYYVQLTLPDRTTRGIGELDTTAGVYRKRIKSGDHFFRLNGEIGFNGELLSSPRFKFSTIEVTLDSETLAISRKDAVRFGHSRSFHGWERQIFVGVKHFRKPGNAIQPEAHTEDLQPSLFEALP
ncbi:MAG: hypothetical protein M1470_02955 [Bacteroidetes bacterium]|nr:hypothetical protein [Bacteroidota bacterium]MCL5739230.1 hypothetical protein [Bacteroidota bacterium]